MTPKLTPAQIQEIRQALTDARQGRATLKQLAHAHEMAEGQQLNGTVGELRDHIRRMTPAPVMKTEAKSILLGVISGVITWFLLGRRPDAR